MKRLTNLLHLVAGLALLAIGAYFLLGVANNWKTWWQRQSASTSQPASNDPALSAANSKVYGVLGQFTGAASANDPPPRDNAAIAPSDRVYSANAGQPNHFLHRRLSVETCQIFEFVVPPHAIHPRLEGTFRPAGVYWNHSGSPSVELLLMNEEGFASFTSNKPSLPVFYADASTRGAIQWPLRGAATAQKYYLVFRNPSERDGPSVVDADFTAAFE